MEPNHPVATAPTYPQFSLRSALIVIGGVCLILAPYQWFGGAYLVSAGFSCTLVVLCSLVYRWTAGGAIVVAVVGLFFAVPASIGAVIYALHAFLNLLLCVALRWLRGHP